MALLSSLIEDISLSFQTENDEELNHRSKYLFDSAYEQIGCEPTSRSLSHKKAPKTPTGSQLRTKGCFKIVHVLNKKFRTSKYFSFVRLQQNKNRPPIQVSKPELELPLMTPPKLKNEPLNVVQTWNLQDQNKFSQAINAVSHKYYDCPHKLWVFSQLKIHAVRRTETLNGLAILDKVFEARKRQDLLSSFYGQKELSRYIQKMELFLAIVGPFLNNNRTMMMRDSFDLLNVDQQPSKIMLTTPSSQILDALLQYPFPSSTRTQPNNKNPSSWFQVNKSFATTDSRSKVIDQATRSKPLHLQSLSSSLNVAVCLQVEGYPTIHRALEHLPLRLNRLHKQQITFDLHDIFESSLFSMSNESSTLSTLAQTERGPRCQRVQRALFQLEDCMYLGTQPQSPYQNDKTRPHSPVHNSQKRPRSEVSSYIHVPIKSYISKNLEKSNESLYSDPQILKLARLHSKSVYAPPQKFSISNATSTPLRNETQIQPRSFNKSSTYSTQPKRKIAMVSKLKLLTERRLDF